MAKKSIDSSLQSADNRDGTQRSLGCVGISAIAHVGLLIVVALAPSFKTQMGESKGSQAGLEFAGIETANASPAPTATAAAEPSSQPTEVLLADANDPNAVALPQTQTPAQPSAPIQEAKPTEVKPVAAIPVETKKTAKPSNDIAAALKAARSQPHAIKSAKAQPTKAADISPAGDIETQAQQPTEEEAAAPLPEKKQVVAINDQAVNDEEQINNDQPAEEEDEDQDSVTQGSAVVRNAEKPKDEEAIPLRIAIPEKEALTTEQENALQAPPVQKSANAIPSNATPIATINSGRPSQAQGQPTTQAARTGTPTTASTQTIGNSAAGQASRGAGTGYSVPLGVPVRDARTLIAVSTPKPTYPLQDKLAGRQGTAVLVAKVKQDGTVENVTLEKSSGSKMMDESAASAFKTWKYKPGQEGYVRLPVQFQLVGDAKIIPSQLKRQ